MVSSMSAMHCRVRLQLTREGEGLTTSAVEARFFVLVRMTYKTSWVIETLYCIHCSRGYYEFLDGGAVS